MNESSLAVGQDPVETEAAQAAVAQGMITRVARGTAWGIAGSGVLFIASLAATPFTIRLFGPSQYGIWALITVVVAYLGFADFGMSPASTRYASEAFTKGDGKREAAVIWTSAVAGLATTMCFVVLLWFMAPLVVRGGLRVPKEYESATLAALRLASLIIVGRVLSGIFNTPELVRLRMGLFNGINSAAAVLQVILVPVVLWRGGGLIGAVAVAAAVAFAAGLAHFVVAGRLFPDFFPPSFSRELIKPLFAFGLPLVFSFLAEIVLYSSEKLVLAHFNTPVIVANYAVAFSYASFLATPSLALSQSLLPAFSRLASSRDQLAEFYGRTVRACLYCLTPACLAAALLCKPFLTLWAGLDYGVSSSLPAYTLIVGVGLDCFSYVFSRLLLGMNRSKVVAQGAAVQVIPYLVLVTVLTMKFGIMGAATAWSLRAAISFAFLVVKARSALGLPVDWLVHPVRLALALAPLAGSLAIFESGIMHGGLAWRFCATAISALVYAILLWTTVLTQAEREWFLRTSGAARLVAGGR